MPQVQRQHKASAASNDKFKQVILILVKYLEFHILASLCFLSFLLSILESSGRIKDFEITGRVRLRNLLDFLMFFLRIPLPIADQLRIPAPPLLSMALGLIIMILGFYMMFSALRKLMPFLMMGKEKRLLKEGVYGVVRHPLYLGDSIWPVGLSIMFRGLCSLILTPIWLLFYIATTFYEEKRLEEEFGEEYREYRRRVKRIIPLIY